ncbi:hypothetical protein [Dulcicalothrix desertica]|nr:hypothetical protein [Dulcicalothrix desertica]
MTNELLPQSHALRSIRNFDFREQLCALHKNEAPSLTMWAIVILAT